MSDSSDQSFTNQPFDMAYWYVLHLFSGNDGVMKPLFSGKALGTGDEKYRMGALMARRAVNSVFGSKSSFSLPRGR